MPLAWTLRHSPALSTPTLNRWTVCGDGVVEGDETCDDGNTDDETSCEYGLGECTACSSDCSSALALEGPFCGDLEVDEEFEECDGVSTFVCADIGLAREFDPRGAAAR